MGFPTLEPNDYFEDTLFQSLVGIYGFSDSIPGFGFRNSPAVSIPGRDLWVFRHVIWIHAVGY